MASGDEVNRLDEVGRVGVLQQDPARPCTQGVEGDLVALGRGEKHHCGVGLDPDAADRRDRAGKVGVHHDDVGAQAPCELDRGIASRRLADDGDPLGGLEQDPESSANERVCVGDHHPNLG